MRGVDDRQDGMFSYISLDARVSKEHPLRPILALVDEALGALTKEFEAMYAVDGRPSIAPERLLRASLLQVLYSVRSERLLCEQLDYNLLFRWFVGLSADERMFDHSTFSKNRDRLLEADIARAQAEGLPLETEESDKPPNPLSPMLSEDDVKRRLRAWLEASGWQVLVADRWVTESGHSPLSVF